MATARQAKEALREHADPQRAAVVARFFRTEPGGYAAGDKFLGLTVPAVRSLARRFADLPLDEIRRLLSSPVHEDRLLALVILVGRARSAPAAEQQRLFRFYVRHRAGVNNWDLVDLSAPALVGPWIEGPARPVVERLSRSRSVWDRRISILAHHRAIREGRGDLFLRFAPRFFDDPHDLIHKATGWMLRECGRRDPAALETFVARHHLRMPRTMLRYAIERFPPAMRRLYVPPRTPRKPRPARRR